MLYYNADGPPGICLQSSLSFVFAEKAGRARNADGASDLLLGLHLLEQLAAGMLG